MIAACSGGAGDIVYAIPTMKELGVTKLYVKQSYYHKGYGSLYTFVKRFVELQGIECAPTRGEYPFFHYEPGLKFDIDLDLSRNQPKRGVNHIMRSFANQFSTKFPDVRQPWLHIDDEPSIEGSFSLICLTPRWRENSRVSWLKVLKSIKDKVYFIGFDLDYETFCSSYGTIDWLHTTDLLDIARLVRDCNALYTNQNASLTIAQGLCKRIFLEPKPNRANTILRTSNESLIDKKLWYD